MEFDFQTNNDIVGTLIQWASSTIPEIHQWYFVNAIKLHTHDLDDRWLQLERETLRIAYNVLNEARLLPKMDPALAGPTSLRDFSTGKLATELLARIHRSVRRLVKLR